MLVGLGRNDNSWDQGQLFISQNTSYLAPHGMSQILISQSYATDIVAVVLAEPLAW